VRPEVDGGRYPAKSSVGELVMVEADIYADGQDALAADLLYRAGGSAWTRVPMVELVNDRWRAAFPVSQMTTYFFTIEAWVDHFATWQHGLAKKVEAGQDVALDLLIGAQLIEAALQHAPAKDAEPLRNAAAELAARTTVARRLEVARDPALGARMRDAYDRRLATRYERELQVQVDTPMAAHSTWYEMFPRSASPDPKRAGTLRDVEARLPYVAGMGFDVLYLPPVHPIGSTKRKGPNGAVTAAPGDPGSPWAIGSEAGGHKAVNPDLGTLADFQRLMHKAKDMGVYVALDIAFQCSPDHPYVREHPEWFKLRPDGSVQFAENPPKKYEDIYPFNFETPAWESLWRELLSVFLFWMEQGVSIFRVDNPHTKPFAFWEWLIGEVRKVDSGVIFLSEAFTRPKIMYHLAKLGFTQSYTYFTWRPDKRGLVEYFTELSTPPVADFFRPNVWPNTPDILTEQLQTGGRPTFVARLVLAATLSANYGMYGPLFELMEHEPREKDSEEYLHSEKYEVRHWDIGRPDSLCELITLINKARRENPALQSNTGLRFHDIDNGQLIAYSKRAEADVVLCIVNLDPNSTQSGWVSLPIEEWGIAGDEPYQVHDVLSDARYTWTGPRNFVQLDPRVMPAHVFRVRRRAGESGWEFR
jgi:starch synthase (maltosyl-transferring)